jgi:rod shape-determining protein MreC
MRLVWWLATVLGVGTVSVFLSHQGTLAPIENASLTVTAPVESGLRRMASPLNNIFQGIADRGDLVRENERLREEIERLQVELAKRQIAEQRIRELEDALQVKQSRPEDQLLAARVIALDPSGLKRTIAIDRGIADGIDEGMVVLSRNGSLVGTVSRAFDDYAWVRLITDPDSVVNAEVSALGVLSGSEPPQVLTPETPAPTAGPTAAPDGEPQASPEPGVPAAADYAEEPGPVRGVAEGHLRQGVLLDLLPPDAVLQEGSLVITSGLGGNYPPGLLIGSITAVESRPQAAFQRATVEPAADLLRLDTVLVIVSFKPARLVGP